ncbi:MAG: TPM domain-containing protein [Elusimicrobia bacterium]|nr:TPM domain-containing protein [Elusimicrobiota bacterium]
MTTYLTSLLHICLLLAAKDIPPSPASHVYNENVISARAENALSSRLRQVEDGSGHQFVTALFQSLEGESLEDYANKVFKAWGVGKRERNDGILFCLFLKEKRWRVEVGYGLEGRITDLEAAELAQAGVPHFKAGDFDAGALAVAEGIAAKILGEPVPAGKQAQFPLALKVIIIVLLLVFVPLFFFMTLPGIFSNDMNRRRRAITSEYWGSGWSSQGGGFGGFSGGGGSSGGGGASGGW